MAVLLTVDQNAVVGAERALALDEAGADHVRPADLAAVHSLDELVEHGVVVAHVAHGGDAGDQVEQGAVLAEVRVHLVQAGHQRAAVAVDGHFAGRGGAVERFDRGDLLAADHHRHGAVSAEVFGSNRRTLLMRTGRRSGARPPFPCRRSAARPVGGELAQPHLFALVALAHDDGVGVDLGEQMFAGSSSRVWASGRCRSGRSG